MTDSPRISRLASLEDDGASTDSLSSLNSEEEQSLYQEFLKEIPVPYCIVRFPNIQDRYSLVFASGNRHFEETTNLVASELVGRLITGLWAWCLDHDEFVLKLIHRVCTSGISEELPDLTYYCHHLKRDVLARTKYIPLPNHNIMVMYEMVHDPEEAKRRRDAERERLENMIERAVDVLVPAGGGCSEMDTNWETFAVKSLLAFGDIGDASSLETGSVGKDKVVQSADVGTLVQNLSGDKDSIAFSKEFLISYRYFMTPKSLLNKLVVKFMAVESHEDKKHKEAIQKRLLKVLKSWVKDHFYDFEDDELLSTLRNFLETVLAAEDSNYKYTKALQKLISKQSMGSRRKTFEISVDETKPVSTEKPSKFFSLLKKRFDIYKSDPTEVAHQLTLLVFDRFKMIMPLELHAQSWSKASKDLTSPNVISLVEHFNKVAGWIAYSIVSVFNLKKRIERLKFFIQIAWAAHNYRDYETTFSIVLALSQFVITRLRDTWKGLGSTQIKLHDKLKEFCSHQQNYRNYRNHMKSGKNFNVMPYMGLYLKDLTNLDENSTMTKAGQVNFYKMRMVARVVSDMQTAQRSIFNFRKNIEILSYLKFLKESRDEDEIWQLSIKCEKKMKEEENTKQFKLKDYIFKEEIVTASSNPIFGLKRAVKVAETSKEEDSD